ncbi:hypothetical protein LDENG_00299050 [Lucifuga dentata]|nr:hypothetical protein LDENG_00299050 [Lucifuga dentata]
MQVRQRTLFVRREQYEQQRIHVPKSKTVPAPNPNRPPPKVVPEPVKPKCSQLTQSCMPHSGCCDPCTSCHCRFFKAICFCLKKSSQCPMKT